MAYTVCWKHFFVISVAICCLCTWKSYHFDKARLSWKSADNRIILHTLFSSPSPPSLLSLASYVSKVHKKSFDSCIKVTSSPNHPRMNAMDKMCKQTYGRIPRYLHLYMYGGRYWAMIETNECIAMYTWMNIKRKKLFLYQYKDKVEGFSIRYRFISSIVGIACTIIIEGIAFSRV